MVFATTLVACSIPKPAKKQKIEVPLVLDHTEQVPTLHAAELPADHDVEQEHSGYFSSEDTDAEHAEQTDDVIQRLEEDISRLHEQVGKNSKT